MPYRIVNGKLEWYSGANIGATSVQAGAAAQAAATGGVSPTQPVIPRLSAEPRQAQTSSLQQHLLDVRRRQGSVVQGTLGLQQPAPVITPTAPSRFASPGQAQAMRAQGVIPSTVIFPEEIQRPLPRTQAEAFSRAQEESGVVPPTGTLGLVNFAPQQPTPTGGPALGAVAGAQVGRAGEIVTGADIRLQNYYRTLNNPRTLGEFIAVGATPILQAQLDALMRGEEIDPVFKRFFLNQGIIEEDDFGITFPDAGLGVGAGTGQGGRRTLTQFPRRSLTQFPGGRNPSASYASLGLVNWRI